MTEAAEKKSMPDCQAVPVYVRPLVFDNSGSLRLKSNSHTQKYTRVDSLYVNYSRGKQKGHANANTHRSEFSYE